MKNNYISPIKTEYTPTTWDELIEFTKTMPKVNVITPCGVACSQAAYTQIKTTSVAKVIPDVHFLSGIPIVCLQGLRWDAVGIDAITFYDDEIMCGFFNRTIKDDWQDPRWGTFLFDVFSSKTDSRRNMIHIAGTRKHEEYTTKDLVELETPLEFYEALQ